jgi:hypothetical protein
MVPILIAVLFLCVGLLIGAVACLALLYGQDRAVIELQILGLERKLSELCSDQQPAAVQPRHLAAVPNRDR